MKIRLMIICLPILVGILCIMPSFPVHAAEVTATTPTDETTMTGETGTRTNINEPGSSDSQDELGELNIANSITVTARGDNGSINGTLRILVVLTLLSMIPAILIMLTSFSRILIVLHFTRAALSTQTAPPNQVLLGLAVF